MSLLEEIETMEPAFISWDPEACIAFVELTALLVDELFVFCHSSHVAGRANMRPKLASLIISVKLFSRI